METLWRSNLEGWIGNVRDSQTPCDFDYLYRRNLRMRLPGGSDFSAPLSNGYSVVRA